MGVTGLWKLIEPSGKPVPVETLEGKILAVDISIWLHQMVKGFQDQKGAALNNAHLLGLFHRLCKLMFYRVKPVFVFDGCVPQLKRDTIINRQEQRSRLNHEADRIQALLLQSLAKEQVVQNALGEDAAKALMPSSLKKVMANANRKQQNFEPSDDIFQLPDVLVNLDNKSDDDEYNDDYNDWAKKTDLDGASTFLFNNVNRSQNSFSSGEEEHSSFEECNQWKTYNNNLQAIDVRSKSFRDLPVDVRHDILIDIQETRKQSSWGRLHEMPTEGKDFSSFQIKRLLKRHDVQLSLEETEKEMGGGNTLTYNELQNLLSEDGVLDPTIAAKASQPIHSDDKTRFLLVKDLKKKLTEPESSEKVEAKLPRKTIEEEDYEKKDENDSISKPLPRSELSEDEDEDLKLAIALSLEESASRNVYDEKDYEYDNQLKLNQRQSKVLKDTIKGPARSYMIEYCGMNDSEVVGLTNLLENEHEETEKSSMQLNEEKEVLEFIKMNENKSESKMPKNIPEESDDSSSHEDWEEMSLSGDDCDNSSTKSHDSFKLSVTIDTNAAPEDDLFADIFAVPAKKKPVSKEESLSILSQLKKELQELKSKTLDEICEGGHDAMYKKKQENRQEKGDKMVEQVEEVPNKGYRMEREEKIEKTQQKFEKKTENFLQLEEKQKNVEEKRKNVEDKIDKTEEKQQKLEENQMNVKGKQKNVEEKRKNVEEKADKTEEKQQKLEDNQVNVKGIPEKLEETVGAKRKSASIEDKYLKSIKSPKGEESHGRNFKDEKISKTTPIKAKDAEETSLKADGGSPAEKGPDPRSILEEAGALLKSQKTRKELEVMANDVADELKELETQRNRQERMGISISQRINEDCQRLLQIFGIPFIVAPMEAEAQCAFLEQMKLTQGTITDDSDIWLFGGHTVYKNFFAHNKHVLEFRSDQIEKDFRCDRNKLIQLACLVGSDYTVGIRGIGTVTALEILAMFSSQPNKSKNTTNQLERIRSNSSVMDTSRQDIFETLEKFRKWWQSSKDSISPVGSTTRLNLLRKLKNIEMLAGFPSMAVIEAYLLPRVDDSREPFSWGQPDVPTIQEFARQNFGWTLQKTNDILQPVLKRLQQKQSQASITKYFNVRKGNTNGNNFLQMSKRVQNAVKRLGDNISMNANSDREEQDSSKTVTNSASHQFIKPSYTAAKPIQLKKLRKKNNSTNRKST